MRSSRIVPRSINALIMVASRASSSISRRGFFFTTFKMSICHTGAKRRFVRAS
jgi:hypothetical protein